MIYYIELSVTPDSYFSTEIEGLVWDQYRGYWTRDDVNTDLSEMYVYIHTKQCDCVYINWCYSHRQLQSLSVDSVTVSRATTPDPIRPNSGMSMTSDFDLQTIPSESVSKNRATVHIYTPIYIHVRIYINYYYMLHYIHWRSWT